MYTLIEYMPACHRASHRAAGNSGIYPHNGARRDWVEEHPDDVLEHLDTEWASVVGWQANRPDDVADDIPADALGGIGY